jgi:hypothetical protein
MKSTSKDPFFTEHPIKGLVSFNFQSNAINDLESYAAGYHEAARALAARMRRTQRPRHFDGFPVLFLYRHALELYLKVVIYLGTQLVSIRDGPEIDLVGLWKEHRLGACVGLLKKVLTELAWIDGFKARRIRSFRDFEKLIEKIDLIDAGSYAFRYPINTRGRRALPKGFSMNALGYARSLDPVLDFLHAAVFGMSAEIEQSLDAP